jgi:AcrR family transcriptional regulator
MKTPAQHQSGQSESTAAVVNAARATTAAATTAAEAVVTAAVTAETAPVPRKKPGRPLSFDRELALEQAMLVFWQYGYDTTSLNDLTGAMGITPPSLYGAFGDKEKLFLEAVQRYAERHEDKISRCLAEAPTAREAVQKLMDIVAIEHTCPQHPPGCMMETVVTNCTAASSHLQTVMGQMKERKKARFTARIQRGIDAGELAPGANAETLSDFYITVLNGMSSLARDKASCGQLQSVVTMAMNAWPAASSSPPAAPAASSESSAAPIAAAASPASNSSKSSGPA